MNFIRKLWNGDFSLPITFWLFLIIGAGILNFTDSSLFEAGYFEFPMTQAKLILITTGAFFHLGYYILILVGVWRSSVKYIESGGSKFWGVASQLFVIIIFIQLIYILLSLAQMI